MTMHVVVHRLVATLHLVGVKKEAGRVRVPAYLGWARPLACRRPGVRAGDW